MAYPKYKTTKEKQYHIEKILKNLFKHHFKVEINQIEWAPFADRSPTITRMAIFIN